MDKREGMENKLKRGGIIKSQKRSTDISNLNLFYSLLSKAKSTELSGFLTFQNGKNSRAEYSVFGRTSVKRLGDIPSKIAQVSRGSLTLQDFNSSFPILHIFSQISFFLSLASFLF